MAKIIAHIDLNAFFVRCEEIRDPSLENKCVAIGHLGRGGVISTCSYKAREYGVKSGLPTFEALKLCPSLILIDGHYHFYQEKSNEFFKYLTRFSNLIEKASVDECFVDLTNYLKGEKNPIKKLEEIRDGLFHKTGLRCSIGVSINKFLAKMASDLHKPMGITIIRKKDIEKMLYPLPIESFYGIGRKTTPKLAALNIHTIGDLAKRLNEDDDELRKLFGITFHSYKDMVNGKSSDVVMVEANDPKSIGHSKTLMMDYSLTKNLIPYLEELTKEVVNEAKKENMLGNTIQITLKNSSFKTITRSKKIEEYTNDFNKVFEVAKLLLEKNHKNNEPIRLIGVTLQNLVSKNEAILQLSIFDDYEKIEEEEWAKLLISKINRKLKKDSLKTLGDVYKERKHGTK